MAEPNPYESPQLAPGRSRATIIILAIGACLLFVLFVLWARGLPPSWVFDYDQAAYRNITKRLASNPQHLRGRRFDDFSHEMGLDDIPWDDINFQAPGPCLMYHFRGFALIVRLEYAHDGVSQSTSQKKQGSAEERLPFRERLRIDSHSRPYLTIDGISTREERMRRHQAMIDKQIEEINKEMDSHRQRRNP
jgi:hypothetical protein